MSVECGAILGYGFIVPNEEFKQVYNEDSEFDPPDYCMWINCYHPHSDIFYGITIAGTEYFDAINPPIEYISEEKWDECEKLFREDFPNRTDEPQYYIISHWY